MIPILNYDVKKKEIIEKLSKVGIMVNGDGTIIYDNSMQGMIIKTKKLMLLRHGKTEGTEKHIFMSDDSPNSKLTLSGKARIKEELTGFCNKQNIEVVIVCSDIPRVLETAEIFKSINPNVNYIYEKKFKGINNSGWERKNKSSLEGEDLSDFIEREEKHNIFAKSSMGTSWGQVLLNTIDLINYLNLNYINKSVLLIGQGSILRAIEILIRKYKTTWDEYDTKKMFNFEQKIENDNYGRISEICNNE